MVISTTWAKVAIETERDRENRKKMLNQAKVHLWYRASDYDGAINTYKNQKRYKNKNNSPTNQSLIETALIKFIAISGNHEKSVGSSVRDEPPARALSSKGSDRLTDAALACPPAITPLSVISSDLSPVTRPIYHAVSGLREYP
ncbi:unnamed protein product [Colias eurytheme]|nr:unnamed protein product [Colias eurytheme]